MTTATTSQKGTEAGIVYVGGDRHMKMQTAVSLSNAERGVSSPAGFLRRRRRFLRSAKPGILALLALLALPALLLVINGCVDTQ